MTLTVILNVLPHCIFLVTGLIGNIFILTVHLLDWLNTREHNPCNLILNGIGISNIFLQGTVVFQEITFFIYTDFYFKDWVIYMLLALLTTFSFSSLWCSTCLCFYYCVKIVNLQGSLFYKIKAKLSTLVPWLLAFSFALSWGAGLPAYWDLYLLKTVTTLNITGNITSVETTKYWSRCNCLFYMYICIAVAAFVIISLTGGTIIISLVKHMRRMRQNNEGFGHTKINSHLSAAKTVTLLLVIYLLFCSSFTVIYNPLGFPDDLTMTVCLIVISSFPSINSIILICGNRKLINFAKKLLGIQPSAGNTEVNVTTY